MSAPVQLSRPDVATLAGVGRATVERAIAAGELVSAEPVRHGVVQTFSVAEVAAWLRRREEEARPAPTGEEDSKARKLAAEAGLKELALAQKRGTLVAAEEVETKWMEMMSAIREAVASIPATLVQANLLHPSDERKADKVVRDSLLNAKAPVRIDE